MIWLTDLFLHWTATIIGMWLAEQFVEALAAAIKRNIERGML